MATLAEKVYESTGNEGGPLSEIVWNLNWMPLDAIGDGQLKEHDREQLMFYFGCAYAIGRLEEPFAAEDALIAAAKEAAVEANRWMTTIGGRKAAEAHSAAVRERLTEAGVGLKEEGN